VLAVLVLSLAFAAGCNPDSDQEQALEEQKQKNEKLQKQLDEQVKEEARRKAKKEEARQKELEQQVNDLQEKVEEQEKRQDEQDQQADSPSGSSEDDVQNSSMTPAQAAEGVVIVSSGFNSNAATAEEATVINAAIEYYQYAEVSDYYTTYNLLSYEDQNNYTQDQWVAANTNLDSAAGEFVVTDAYPDDLGLGVPTYAVTLTIYMTDGSSFNRTTYFINEGGYWGLYLSGEEVDMFDGALY